jgi:hypothetical protein
MPRVSGAPQRQSTSVYFALAVNPSHSPTAIRDRVRNVMIAGPTPRICPHLWKCVCILFFAQARRGDLQEGDAKFRNRGVNIFLGISPDNNGSQRSLLLLSMLSIDRYLWSEYD